MFLIKALAEVRQGGRTNTQMAIDVATGVARRTNPMTAYYQRGGQTALGGNSRTRGRGRSITRVTRGR